VTAYLAITPGERYPLFMDMVCGGCGETFTANARTVPCFQTPSRLDPARPSCRRCWDQLAQVRSRANLVPWSRPMCYPEDYPII
jgi:hypothetical protein